MKKRGNGKRGAGNVEIETGEREPETEIMEKIVVKIWLCDIMMQVC